ncbi:hypothetical protein SAMN04488061_1727 [Filomicrobium insigne]|uniref:Uncharacterized protein n=1 Tax=Filomicrobium insigne TaxID=418854 RepID=A0A1H0MM57_9HYPH|nr:hypothetical protein SAMN04488061_1727 [Filomicrobium insigne]
MKGLFLAVAFAAVVAIWTLNARAQFPASDLSTPKGEITQFTTIKAPPQR